MWPFENASSGQGLKGARQAVMAVVVTTAITRTTFRHARGFSTDESADFVYGYGYGYGYAGIAGPTSAFCVVGADDGSLAFGAPRSSAPPMTAPPAKIAAIHQKAVS